MSSAPFPSTASTALWGVISVGIFANGKYGAGPALPDGKFGPDGTGVVGQQGVTGAIYGDVATLGPVARRRRACVFGFTVAYVLFQFSNLITPIRVSKEAELEGLDVPELGVLAYPDFPIKAGAMDP